MNLSIKKNSKSAQASIEFLMTYGWMILIVLIVGVLVFSFINFGSLLPTKVELSGSFKGDPSRVVASSGDSGVLQVLVKYAGANSVIINDAKDISLDAVDSKNCTFYSMTDSAGNTVDASALNGDREILFINGQESLVTFDCSKGTEFVEGDVLQGDIRIKYSDSRNPGLDLTSTGEIRVAISDMSINLTELANGESNKNGESSEDDPALSVECYSSSNVGKIGTSGVCEGMLIVDEDMLRGAEEIDGGVDMRINYSDGESTIEFTFGDSDFNVFTGQVTDMRNLFRSTSFNSDINYWDVSNVEDIRLMFRDADSFNQPLNNWDVSNVEDMGYVFRDTNFFNQPLDNWDVSSATDMNGMFRDANNFNQPLDSWDVSNVKGMGYMFEGASSFNQPLNSWDVSNVESMNYMFKDAQNFNQPLNSWDVSNVKNMTYMFRYASSFNQPLNNWDVSNVEKMNQMFRNAESFNQPLDSWNVSSVIDMQGMFQANNFNQPLNDWDVSNVRHMSYMFYDSDSFNQDLTQWCVSQFESEPSGFASNPPLESSNKPKWGESCP